MSGVRRPEEPGDGGREPGPVGEPGDVDRDRRPVDGERDGDPTEAEGDQGLEPADAPSRLVLTVAPFVLAALLWWLLAVLVS